jgi:peroxiredoxin
VTESEKASFSFNLATTTTDDQGRWRIDEAPANLGPVHVFVEHPRYRKNPGARAGGRESLVVLEKGLVVKGRVIDSAGKPIKGAKVIGHNDRLSQPPKGTTNDLGEFVLTNCEPGRCGVTVQARGFAPDLKEIAVGPRGETTTPEFRLEPGAVLRVKVVDRTGKPVAGANVAADNWRGRQSINYWGNTNAEGRVTWPSAPRDAVQFDIFLDGYMRRRLVPLVASAEEQVVTLDPALVVSGRVTDAATGQPVPRFRIIQGWRQSGGTQETRWSNNEAVEYTGGSYSTRFDFPTPAHFVKVEAPGYEPADSRAFQSDEGAQTQDFALQPAAKVSGVVLLPGGKPAEGVTVALATQDRHVSLRGGLLERDTNAPHVTTASDGRFTFTAPEEGFLLIALSDAGYADASSDEFPRSGTLKLVPWGTLVGQVRVGRKPDAHREVAFTPTRPDRGGGMYVFSYGYETDSDAQGRFGFDRVIPGRGSVSRVLITEFGGGQQHMPGWWEPVEIKPGGTTEVEIGGKGRPVVGRIVLDGTPESPIAWRTNEPVVIDAPRGEDGRESPSGGRFGANLDEDGRFRVEDVPAGRYTLTVPVNLPPTPRSCGSGAAIGRAHIAVEVPAGFAVAPLDLGEIKAELFPVLKVGDLAPDFTASALDGKRFRLSDFNGKLILLDFWATWCAPCLAELPALQDLQQTFGADPRFVLVGMACDEEREAPGRYAQEHGLAWTQAFAGNLHAGPAAGYHVRAIPATFLIGPDGRILAKNLRGAALKEAVRSALKDQ